VLNLVGAVAMLALMGTGLVGWLRRRSVADRRSGDVDADLLVGFASQTGTAARLAEATATALRSGGNRVACAALSRVSPDELRRYRQVLLVVSTTGEGAVPENGRAFLDRLKGTNLVGTAFCLLALGDSRYARFCAGGETVRAVLLAAGAHETLALARADGDPQAPWRAWLQALTRTLDIKSGEARPPDPDRPVTLTVVGRRQLNDPRDRDTSEAWNVTLRSEQPLDYRPGDLLLISPGEGEPERCYSIGSSPLDDAHRIELTVGLLTWQDGRGEARLGRASGLLCRSVRDGDVLAARLRRRPDFNPPLDRSYMMVATGCGIAPFVGFLAERAHRRGTGKAWLFFGNRRKGADYFYADRLRRWQADGTLDTLTTAFSRDAEDGAYVQDRLVEHGAELLRWLEAEDAILFVCGRTGTTGRGVDEALRQVLTAHGGQTPQQAAARLEAWIDEGRVRRDLFE
jgi:sulfite reductase (NADPH) flavoprotein alpha-component